VIWIILISPLFLFPYVLNPAALVTVGGFLVLLLVYYFAWARRRFHGPVPQGSAEELEAIEREFEDAARQMA
jgi:hypothetical protein